MPTIARLKEYWKDNTKTLRLETVKKLSLDTSKDNIILGNFKLIKNTYFFSEDDYEISINNINNDLNNQLIKENNKLLKYLQDLWHRKINTIHTKDLLDKFDIHDELTEIKIGNLNLERNRYKDCYYISLIEKEKGIYDKWIDSAVTKERVLIALEEFKSIIHSDESNFKEKQVESKLVEYLSKKFENIQPQYIVGGSIKALKIDIDLGNGAVGVEIKLAQSLIDKIEEYHRIFGQLHSYSNQKYKDNIIVVVAGNTNLMNNLYLKNIQDEVKNRYKGEYFFLPVEHIA